MDAYTVLLLFCSAVSFAGGGLVMHFAMTHGLFQKAQAIEHNAVAEVKADLALVKSAYATLSKQNADLVASFKQTPPPTP